MLERNIAMIHFSNIAFLFRFLWLAVLSNKIRVVAIYCINSFVFINQNTMYINMMASWDPIFAVLWQAWNVQNVRAKSMNCIPAMYRVPIHSPEWGDKVDYGIGLSGYIGWRAGTTTLCRSRLYPPVRTMNWNSIFLGAHKLRARRTVCKSVFFKI